MNKIFDEYSRKARFFPAFLCSLPFILIKHRIIDPFVGVSLSDEFFKVIIGDVSLTVVLIYLFSQINRLTSKIFFENKSNFPTTLMLMPTSTELSADFKKKIAERVKSDFQILMPSLQDEQSDLPRTRTRIGEVVSLIIHKVGNGRLLLQHNIEYGFMRNLIGGSLISLLASVTGIFLFKFTVEDHVAFVTSIGFSICYLVLILFSKVILGNLSKEYARILFREYIGTK